MNRLTDAQRELAAAHTYLIGEVSGPWLRRYGRQYGNDIRSAAMWGLCGAAERWRPGGAAFPTFARARMWGAIQDELCCLRRYGMKWRPDNSPTPIAIEDIEPVVFGYQPAISPADEIEDVIQAVPGDLRRVFRALASNDDRAAVAEKLGVKRNTLWVYMSEIKAAVLARYGK